MVIARDGSTISFFEVGCIKTGPVARQVTIAVRRSGSPVFSTSGRFLLQGELDDSGVLVVRGEDANELQSAIAAATDDEQLVFVGDEVLATRENRFEFSWPITRVRRWFEGDDVDTVLYGSQVRGDVPPDKNAQRCRVVDE